MNIPVYNPGEKVKPEALLVKNGTVVNADSLKKASFLCVDGKIRKLGSVDEVQAAEDFPDLEVIDASGLYVLPGLIDAHTHYHLVSRGTVTADSFVQGSRLAAFGGVTTVIDFADHNRGQNLEESLDFRLGEMSPDMAIDYTLHQGVYGHGFGPDIPQQLEKLRSRGVRTLKIFTTYRNTGYLIENREDLEVLFREASRLGLLVTAHCEFNPLVEELSDNWKGSFLPSDHALMRPAEAEGLAIRSLGELALQEGCPLYVVHVSSRCGLEAIRDLRKRGAVIYAETTPHYLFLDRSLLATEDGPLYVMTPPLRDSEDNRALQEAVLNGEIQVVATDHCAFTREQKLSSTDCRTIYPGIPGTEELLLLLSTFLKNSKDGKEEDYLCKTVSLLADNPSKIFGICSKKGAIEVGRDADFVLFDPTVRRTLEDSDIHSASGYTPYRGFEVDGLVKSVYLRGECLVRDSLYKGESGSGRFVPQT